MSARARKWTNLFTRTLGALLLLGACGVAALTPAAAQSQNALRMARNAEPGIFIPWLIDDNTAPAWNRPWRPRGRRPRTD